ncbi:MAG: family transporter [Frankiales bacterium]|nr:family transporter [Frankiales bacterium]
MRSLARFSFRHRRLVLASWIGLLLVLGGAVGTVGAAYDDQFSLPQTESTEALELLQRVSPSAAGDQVTAVLHVEDGSVTDPAARARFTSALQAADAFDTVASVASPYAAGGEAQVSADGRTAFATITLAGRVPNDVTSAQVDQVLDAMDPGVRDGVQVEITGQAAQGPPAQGLAEVVGLAAAAIVLFVVFGSLLAMSLPLITAVLSIAVSISAISLLTQVFTIATFAPTLSVLLGLGVGIDYALFIVTRYRQGLLEGKSPEEATVTAVDTSGRAVLFAGITVCIALLGLFSLGLSFLYGVAVAASLAVAVTVAASLTLLPALLGFFGRRVLPNKLRDRPAADPQDLQQETRGWQRWAAVLDRRPALIGALGLVVMLVVAAPFLHLRLGLGDQGSGPADATTRQGYDLLAEGFGPGFNGPLLVVTDLGDSADTAATDRLRAALADDGDVAAVSPTVYLGGAQPGVAAPGGIGLTTVYPASAPQDEATSDLVSRVRTELVPAAEQGGEQRLLVGGTTAIGEDFSDTIADKLPLFVGVVVLLSFLLLIMVFRSLVVAAVAAAMNLLSAAAAFGIVVAVFQDGFGLSLLGVDRTGPILAFLPVILFAILFGLSMDYEVFLLSRIHEEWLHRGDNRQAVLHGLAATGRTITAAAAIMVMLFLAFVLGPDLTIKLFGFGLAAAVLLDALVVRSVLVPAIMLLLGRANWYLPAWLDRVLPQLSVEGPAEPESRPVLETAGV